MITNVTLAEVSEQIRTQKVTPTEVTEACLARIEQLNPTLNAFITVMADEARAAAKIATQEITAGNWRGPLHGVPIAFKDMYDTAGIKTTAAFEHFAHRVPHQDAVAVQKMKEAGAVIVGKTNLHTLAMGTTSTVSAAGPVHNPWNIDYIAGGSSGGSAAAVAAGMCFATIDTDAVGSTRLPAACCGVVGYKCTWGKLDNTGVLAGEQADPVVLQLATVGITARSAVDVAIVADALGSTDMAAQIAEPQPKLRIGVVTNFGGTEQVRTSFEHAVQTLRTLGYTYRDAEAPFTEQPDMGGMEAARATANDRIFKDVDVLVLPTLAAEVPTITAAGTEDPQALSPQNTFFANYEALPAISVPAGLDAHGLPQGLQIVGKQGADATVLTVAQAFLNKAPLTHPKEITKG
jgi:aspartyl-tRNA(Asn)/glutamyl-tRNA(Gln) amidotransferase subunit A